MDEHALAQVLFCALVRLPEGLEDDAVDLGRGHARHRAGLVLSPLGQEAGDVVAIAGAVLDRVARGHAVAAIVEDAPEQKGVGARSGAPLAAALLVEPRLHGLEQRAFDNRLVLAGMALGLVVDRAEVDPVAQKMGERAVAEGTPPTTLPEARASRVGGIVTPSALAVLRLITSSNLVGCSTGRSDGFAPSLVANPISSWKRLPSWFASKSTSFHRDYATLIF